MESRKISSYFQPVKRRVLDHDGESALYTSETSPTDPSIDVLSRKAPRPVSVKLDASFLKSSSQNSETLSTPVEESSQSTPTKDYEIQEIIDGITPEDLIDDFTPPVNHIKDIVSKHEKEIEDKIRQKKMERFVEIDADAKRKMEKKERFKVANKSKYAFLDNLMDENKNPIGSKNYDPTTLHIPTHILAQMTPFEKQYWEIKMKRFDTIIFFNKGKFYELMEHDAEIAQRVLGMAMTERAGMRMCGMPKTSFYHNCTKLIRHGYKVCRVVQTETPVDRLKKVGTGKIEDVMLERTVDRIITPGTIVEHEILEDHSARFLLCLKQNESTLGVCIVDAAAAEFQLGVLEDDNDFSKLRTLLFQLRPKEVVYQKGNLSSKVLNMLKLHLDSYAMMTCRNVSDFWDYETTIDKLSFDVDLLISKEESSLGHEKIQSEIWPEALRFYKDNRIVIESFGACISYLVHVQLAEQLLRQRKIEKLDIYKSQKCMVLDSKALGYLEIIENSWDHSTKGSLYEILEHCKTTFGKRLMRKWIIHPLLKIEDINERLNSVDLLVNESSLRDSLDRYLKTLPDLERLFSRVCSGTLEVDSYRKLLDSLQRTLNFFKDEVPSILEFIEDRSCYIIKLLQFPNDRLPDFTSSLESVQSMLSPEDLVLGKVEPLPGFDSDYDEIKAKLNDTMKEMDEYLKLQREHFKSTQVNYVDNGKNYYLIEVPNKVLESVKAPKEYQKHKKSTTKLTRYYTPKILELLPIIATYKRDLELAEASVLKKCVKVLADNYHTLWSRVVLTLAEIDCLNSLGTASSLWPYMCRPNFVESEVSFIDIKDMRHPCMIKEGKDFIPNDLSLSNSTILLTGPNMGGKSTILRQLCINVIMAQIGCYVCATELKLSPIDRIFTRIGASDNIFEGQSTFMTEIQDTSTMLNYATPRSLVILDELGRGTSTFDGYSIAYATLMYISSNIKCRTLFSTHFHLLADDIEASNVNNVELFHMTADVDERNDDVTFLYKMERGSEEKVYGMQVARMAGVPQKVVNNAKDRALVFKFATQLKHKNMPALYAKIQLIKSKLNGLKERSLK